MKIYGIIRRSGALIFALMILLSPVVSYASDTAGSSTHTGSSGSTHGGTSGSFGVPDPTIETNADGTRTLSLYPYWQVRYGSNVALRGSYDVKISGSGHFVIRCYSWDYKTPSGTAECGVTGYIFSDKPFTLVSSYTPLSGTGYTNSLSSKLYNGIYYSDLCAGCFNNLLLSNLDGDYEFSYGGFSNVSRISSRSLIPTHTGIIDGGTLDLTKDDWRDPDLASAVYNKSLDFSSISADYKIKYTIEKNNEGHFEFISPDEAGIQFQWINRTDIDGAYVRFNVYGEYYDSFWGTSYTNTYVTLTCPRRNDLSYLCKQKDLIALAKEKCNGSKGYGFVVNYIYVQSFAYIDGKMCRSRIYKFNSDLVSDYGNAELEDDEWVPEITGGDSMPDSYDPDPDNPDPEKIEPSPDSDDDTVVVTPVGDDDVVINDDKTLIMAFEQFVNVMKQGVANLGEFPALVSAVFSFIPSIFLIFIGVGFALAIALRFLGR